MSLTTGATLNNRYEIETPLGRGDLTYLAQDRRLGRQCVVKALPLPPASDPTPLQQEAQLLANLDHPNLPEVYDLVLHDEHPFLVIEFIEGDTLDQLQASRSAPFSPSQVLEWAHELLDVLCYLHERIPPMLHRDIRPKNVCITPGEKAVLLDLGISLHQTHTHIHPNNYTPIEQYPPGSVGPIPIVAAYLAALQTQGWRTAPHTDVYGLGATLYFALTQRPPLDAPTRVQNVALRDPREINPQVPAYVADAVMQALRVHPAERFQSADEMRAAMPKNPPLPTWHQPQVQAALDTPFELPSARAPTPISISARAPSRDPAGMPTTFPLPSTVSPAPGPAAPPRRRRSRGWLALGVGLALAVLALATFAIFVRPHGDKSPTSTASATAPEEEIAQNIATPTHTASPTASATALPTEASKIQSQAATPWLQPTPSETPSATPIPSPTPYSFSFSVEPDTLPIFAAPGENYPLLDTVRRGDRLQVVARSEDGEWWAVDFFSQRGWHRAQPSAPGVSPVDLPVATAPSPPTVTPAPPTPTPSPTVTLPPPCAVEPFGELGQVWREPLIQARLGCPFEYAYTTQSAKQSFEYGLMYWRQDIKMIYVLHDDGRWQEFPDTWQENKAGDGQLAPPPGLFEPVRGFGKVWREGLGGENAVIGWATENEAFKITTVEDFERGVIVQMDGLTYLLYRSTMTWQLYAPGTGVVRSDVRAQK